MKQTQRQTITTGAKQPKTPKRPNPPKKQGRSNETKKQEGKMKGG